MFPGIYDASAKKPGVSWSQVIHRTGEDCSKVRWSDVVITSHVQKTCFATDAPVVCGSEVLGSIMLGELTVERHSPTTF